VIIRAEAIAEHDQYPLKPAKAGGSLTRLLTESYSDFCRRSIPSKANIKGTFASSRDRIIDMKAQQKEGLICSELTHANQYMVQGGWNGL